MFKPSIGKDLPLEAVTLPTNFVSSIKALSLLSIPNDQMSFKTAGDDLVSPLITDGPCGAPSNCIVKKSPLTRATALVLFAICETVALLV